MSKLEKKVMKKNNFIQGAFIAMFGVIISKILGVIYVIPFYAIIGEQGGALYGYAYNIYSIFLGLSTAGIPLAVSKIVSEYNALGYYESKEKAFKIAKRILSILGIICFILLVIFANPISNVIIGDIQGGNTRSDIVFVIRAISLSIVVVPILSVYRGYLQGHKYITPTSISQVLEQIVRVLIIIIGSYLAIKIFNMPLKNAVAIALLGATIGAIVSFLYLLNKVKKHKNQLNPESIINKEEKVVSTKEIIIKVFAYSFPAICGDVCKSLYNSVDTLFLVKCLVNDFGYLISSAESIMSVISTWGNKFNMIVIAIGTGFTISMIPNLTDNLVKGKIKELREKIKQALQMIIYFTLPMTVGLSFLAKPVWTIFYGQSTWGPLVFKFSIFTAFVTVILTTCTTTTIALKKYKLMLVALLTGLLVKIIFNSPIIHLFGHLNLAPYNGAIATTLLGNIISICIIILSLTKEYKLDLKSIVFNIIRVIFGVICMFIILTLFSKIIPIVVTSKIQAAGLIGIYTIIGGITYLFIMKITKSTKTIFKETKLVERFKFLS